MCHLKHPKSLLHSCELYLFNLIAKILYRSSIWFELNYFSNDYSTIGKNTYVYYGYQEEKNKAFGVKERGKLKE